MLRNLTGWHALIILAIVLLLFGAAKLPTLARSVGQSVKILRTEVADQANAHGEAEAPVPTGTEATALAGEELTPEPERTPVPTGAASSTGSS